MTRKYLSLSLCVLAALTLLFGVFMIAGKIGSILKRGSAPPSTISIPQLKPELFAETADFAHAFKVNQTTAMKQNAAADAALPAAMKILENSGNYPTLFAGAGKSVAASKEAKLVSRPVKSKNVASGTKPSATSTLVTEPQKTELPNVTVIVADGKDNKAVINGTLVGANAQLTGGYSVREINIDSVVVVKDGETTVIKMPLDRLRVLGVRDSYRTKAI